MIVRSFRQGILNNNVYVVENNGECVVVDCAYGDNDVADYITKNGLTLKAVLLTHGHFDHCGGVKRLLDACGNVPVYVHVADKLLCETASGNLWHRASDNCFPTNFYTEGKFSVGGFEFEVIFTPGHTHGSVILLVGNAMFSGDTLFAGTIGRTDFADSSFEEMQHSLQKIKHLNGDYVVYPGHMEATTLQEEKQHNAYLKLL